MLLQPDFHPNPFSIITEAKNRKFAGLLQANGANDGQVASILQKYFSYKVVLKELSKEAKNPEWLETVAWYKQVDKHYAKAISNLEILLTDNAIPTGTKEIVKKDVENLKVYKEFLAQIFMPKPSIKPKPQSCHQMIGFQSYALYKYLRKFKGDKTDKDLYSFIAELLQKLYQDTALNSFLKNINGDILKNNFIDNVDKTCRIKYKELENSFKAFD